ncbi:TraB/GumN family protein [Chloroflexota bacterium]
MGSIHVAGPDIYPMDSSIEDAFAQADSLVVEVDITKVDEERSVQLIVEHGLYPQGKTLQNGLPEELYAQLAEQFAQLGSDIATLDMFRPWVVSVILEQLQLEEFGYLPEYGIDLHFLNKAAETDKDIIELETADFQSVLIASFPDELMILLLKENAKNPLSQDEATQLFSVWEDGDSAEMEAILFEALIEEPALTPFYEKMIDERNFNMAEQIEEFFTDDETYFVVVGAGHLVGENGLINILDERGYVIEQLHDSDQ